MAQGRFVSYLRVSTDRQGKSGLGLEAQRKAVEDFLNGGSWKLIDEFVEVAFEREVQVAFGCYPRALSLTILANEKRAARFPLRANASQSPSCNDL